MLLKLGSALLLVGFVASQTKYCCTPSQWESGLNLISGGITKGKPFFDQMWENNSIDGNAHKVASSIRMETNGVVTEMKVIQDFDNAKQYAITNGVCQTTPLKPWTPKCIPDDAELLTKTYLGTGDKKIDFDVYKYTVDSNTFYLDIASTDCVPLFLSESGSNNDSKYVRFFKDDAELLTKTYYGTGDKKIDADVYKYTLGVNTNYVEMASADCVPLFLSESGSNNDTTAFTIGTYTNVTLGIKDPSVFDIPAICNHQPLHPHVKARRVHPLF